MKRLLFWLIVVVIVGGGVSYGSWRLRDHWRGRTVGRYRTAAVSRGEITAVVTSSGTVQPVRSVQVGAFVSGPIQKICVDFNSRVKAGDVLAEIDPRTYKATVQRDEASLGRAKADLRRVRVLLEQAKRNEQRVMKLRAAKKTFISETELDQATVERESLEAQMALGEAVVCESEATLVSSRTNLAFATIKSPVDGIVIDRKVDPGQTLASTFQTPVMFIVSPDLEKKVYVYASVDEADIGLIRDADSRKQPVRFTADAYPNDVFNGAIAQIRLNPTTIQHVVTYTVVVESANTELKLLPGMTAALAFQTEKRTNILRIPNAALRFIPKADEVRPQDRDLLEIESETEAKSRSAVIADRVNAAAEHSGMKKRVWIIEGGSLAAVGVITGVSDTNFTELASGPLREGQELVTEMRSVTTAASQPFSNSRE